MTSEQKTNIKVGATVLVGVLVFLLGVGWVKGWGSIFSGEQQAVRARFVTTGGLEVGDPVSLNGVKAGTVSRIDPDDSGVTVAMTFPTPVALSQDVTAHIAMLELMGGKKVELLNGRSPKMLPPGAIIHGEFSGDIGSLVALVTSLGGNIRSLTVHADTLLDYMNNFLRNNDLKGTVNKTFADAQHTLEHFDLTAGKVNALLDDNSAAFKQTLTQAQAATKDLAELLQEDRPMIHALLDTSGTIMSGTKALILHATGIFAQIDTLLADAQHSNTLLFKLAKDREFGNRIDSLIIHVDKFIEQTRHQGIDANIRFFNSTKPAP